MSLREQTLTEWQRRARKALDTWPIGGLEESAAAAIQQAHRDGIKHAAKVVEEKGDAKMAMELRRLADRS
jgi:hypothetical protein